MRNDHGSFPLALLILIGLAIALMAGLAVCGDALFEDEDEVDDLGAPALVLDHDRDCRGGGCGNEREESYDQAGCKYLCPSFDRSPVENSFNPTICVMPGSCSDRERQPA